MKLAVNTIRAKRAKSDVVKRFLPPIIRNLLVAVPLLKIYARRITSQERNNMCFAYFFNH